MSAVPQQTKFIVVFSADNAVTGCSGNRYELLP
jgi:hypothetical protein